MPKSKSLTSLLAVTVAGLSLAAVALAGSQQQPLKPLGHTNIPGYTGDFDAITPDPALNRIFMAAEDHGTVEVFNLETGEHLRTLTTFGTPHQIFLVPGTRRMIVTDSGKDGTAIVDTVTYKVLGHIKLAPGADEAYYDPSTRHYFIVTGGEDVDMKVCYLNEIDPWTGRVLARLKFDSHHTETLRAEQQGDRMFINLADKNEVDVLSKSPLEVIARWPIVGAKKNLTMALDEPDHRLFVVTRDPTRMFVLDSDSGRAVQVVDVPAVNDGVFWDAKRKRLYVPGAANGEVGVYQLLDRDHVKEIARVPTAVGGKSGAFSPKLDELWVAASPGERVGGEILWYRVQ
jgi:DNA-binding beta-propeller fold protein YncE